MPLFSYKCPTCEKQVQRILKPEEAASQHCPDDGAELVRTPRLASSQVKEVVDNGLMSRRVEIVKPD